MLYAAESSAIINLIRFLAGPPMQSSNTMHAHTHTYIYNVFGIKQEKIIMWMSTYAVLT